MLLFNSRADTPSGKIARLIAVGNQLRHQRKGTNYSLNHNTAYFDQNSYGTTAGFKLLVEHIDAMAGQWCKDRPPKPEKDSFLALKKAFLKKERGTKVLKATRPKDKANKSTA